MSDESTRNAKRQKSHHPSAGGQDAEQSAGNQQSAHDDAQNDTPFDAYSRLVEPPDYFPATGYRPPHFTCPPSLISLPLPSNPPPLVDEAAAQPHYIPFPTRSVRVPSDTSPLLMPLGPKDRLLVAPDQQKPRAAKGGTGGVDTAQGAVGDEDGSGDVSLSRNSSHSAAQVPLVGFVSRLGCEHQWDQLKHLPRQAPRSLPSLKPRYQHILSFPCSKNMSCAAYVVPW